MKIWLKGVIVGGVLGLVLYLLASLGLWHCSIKQEHGWFTCLGWEILTLPMFTCVEGTLEFLGFAYPISDPLTGPYFISMVRIFSCISYIIFFAFIGLTISLIFERIKNKKKK